MAIAKKLIASDTDPRFVVAGGGRPGVDRYATNYKYFPGDKVYLLISGQREGLYKIESAEDGMYTLCNDSGIAVKDGQAYGEDELELHDPFA